MEGAPIKEPDKEKETAEVIIKRIEFELDIARNTYSTDYGLGQADNPKLMNSIEFIGEQLAKLKETLKPSETES